MSSSIKLLFSGDFAPLFPPDKIRNDHFSEILDILSSANCHITNLECALTDNNISIEKSGPAIKANVELVKLLEQAKVSIACLANNHIFDYGEKGILDTIKICENNHIETIGLVFRPDKKENFLIKEFENKKVGFINYCEHEFSVREARMLGANGYNSVNAFYDINNIRSKVDYLIVIYHGGNEYYSLPRPDIKKEFHYLIDLGADAVISHHTHVISGYEIYKNKPIVYGLGNFFFPYDNEPEEWNTGLLCSLELEDKIKVTLIPFSQNINDLQIKKVSGKKLEEINRQIEHLSSIIQDEKELNKYWIDFVNSKGNNLSKLFLFSSRIEKLLYKIPVFKSMLGIEKRSKIIRNIIRCQSLQQLLTENLKNKNDSRNS